MKVLIAIDGSDSSLRATRYVLDHAEIFSAMPDITLINVHLPVPSPRARAWLGQDVLDQYYAEESEEALKAARVAVADKGRKANEITRIGNPAKEIADAATSIGCPMIVMGTHGRSGLGTLVMGSVATQVVARAKVPVLLVK
jgi:nucleotide-binding universal stress UspA family protein